MEKQLTIDDFLNEKTTSKRLVKERLHTLEHVVLKDLKTYHVSKKNAVNMSKLAYRYDVSDRDMRTIIKHLRTYQDVMVSSCSNGYYIPLESEQDTANQMIISRALSSLDTMIDINNKYILIAYKHLNERLKTLDTATQNQMKMQFNGWERDTVNRFGDKYIKDENATV